MWVLGVKLRCQAWQQVPCAVLPAHSHLLIEIFCCSQYSGGGGQGERILIQCEFRGFLPFFDLASTLIREN